MLFSSPKVAQYVNEHFEPVWQSVREVPTVTIDFGNGKKMTRTMNGNIATYICNNQGYVIDVLPGIYDQETYLAGLQGIHELSCQLPTDSKAFDLALLQHHRTPARSLVETASSAVPGVASPAVPLDPTSMSPMSISMGKEQLMGDVNLNENERRPMIHTYLSARVRTRPEDMKKWLYREVLHADLDDPMLGLGKVLGQNYPFDDTKG